jgi:hypothetical protein
MSCLTRNILWSSSVCDLVRFLVTSFHAVRTFFQAQSSHILCVVPLGWRTSRTSNFVYDLRMWLCEYDSWATYALFISTGTKRKSRHLTERTIKFCLAIESYFVRTWLGERDRHFIIDSALKSTTIAFSKFLNYYFLVMRLLDSPNQSSVPILFPIPRSRFKRSVGISRTECI